MRGLGSGVDGGGGRQLGHGPEQEEAELSHAAVGSPAHHLPSSSALEQWKLHRVPPDIHRPQEPRAAPGKVVS